MTPKTVFLIEMMDGPGEPLKYVSKVYLSQRKARESVEYWAPRAGVTRFRWKDHNTGVLTAEDEDSGRIWHIVPLPGPPRQ